MEILGAFIEKGLQEDTISHIEKIIKIIYVFDAHENLYTRMKHRENAK